MPLHPDALPQWDAFVSEVLTKAEIAEGDQLGRVTVTSWKLTGDHAHMAWSYDGQPRAPEVLIRPRDDQDGAFLRTPRWNISYLGPGFDRITEALLREVAHRLELTCSLLDYSQELLLDKFFKRPDVSQLLEVTSGRKLYLRVTDYCDENCVFCNATEGNTNVISSKSQLRRILDQLPAGGLKQVIFSGGEPTLIRALPQMVGLAYERGAEDIIVQTNGVILAKPGVLERYLPYRDRLGIGFSLHAFETKASDLLTAAHDVPKIPLAQRYADGLALPDPERERPDSGRLSKKLQAIDAAVAMGFKVKITCVVMRPNLESVPDFARHCWERWGSRLDRLQFSYAMPRGNAMLNNQWAVSFSECKPYFLEAFEIGRETGMRVETSQSAAIAPCVIPEYLEHFDIYGDFGEGRVADPERVKPDHLCKDCAFDQICAGVWQRYLDVFGEQEIQAITDRPTIQMDIDDYYGGEVLDLVANVSAESD
ncbi:MAG: hypothetical protein CMH53_00740 [Myxococcales bacterium]|nr:hypothetical protein [Myxococcales bacterium]